MLGVARGIALPPRINWDNGTNTDAFASTKVQILTDLAVLRVAETFVGQLLLARGLFMYIYISTYAFLRIHIYIGLFMYIYISTYAFLRIHIYIICAYTFLEARGVEHSRSL